MKYAILPLLVLLTIPAFAETGSNVSAVEAGASAIPVENQQQVQDLSVGGAALCLENPLDPGDKVSLSCSATAQCLTGGTVSCVGNSSCNVYHASCSNLRGSVKCDGQTTLCPPVCRCSDGCCQNNSCFVGCSGGYGELSLCF